MKDPNIIFNIQDLGLEWDPTMMDDNGVVIMLLKDMYLNMGFPVDQTTQTPIDTCGPTTPWKFNVSQFLIYMLEIDKNIDQELVTLLRKENSLCLSFLFYIIKLKFGFNWKIKSLALVTTGLGVGLGVVSLIPQIILKLILGGSGLGLARHKDKIKAVTQINIKEIEKLLYDLIQYIGLFLAKIINKKSKTEIKTSLYIIIKRLYAADNNLNTILDLIITLTHNTSHQNIPLLNLISFVRTLPPSKQLEFLIKVFIPSSVLNKWGLYFGSSCLLSLPITHLADNDITPHFNVREEVVIDNKYSAKIHNIIDNTTKYNIRYTYDESNSLHSIERDRITSVKQNCTDAEGITITCSTALTSNKNCPDHSPNSPGTTAFFDYINETLTQKQEILQKCWKIFDTLFAIDTDNCWYYETDHNKEVIDVKGVIDGLKAVILKLDNIVCHCVKYKKENVTDTEIIDLTSYEIQFALLSSNCKQYQNIISNYEVWNNSIRETKKKYDKIQYANFQVGYLYLTATKEQPPLGSSFEPQDYINKGAELFNITRNYLTFTNNTLETTKASTVTAWIEDINHPIYKKLKKFEDDINTNTEQSVVTVDLILYTDDGVVTKKKNNCRFSLTNVTSTMSMINDNGESTSEITKIDKIEKPPETTSNWETALNINDIIYDFWTPTYDYRSSEYAGLTHSQRISIRDCFLNLYTKITSGNSDNTPPTHTRDIITTILGLYKVPVTSSTLVGPADPSTKCYYLPSTSIDNTTKCYFKIWFDQGFVNNPEELVDLNINNVRAKLLNNANTLQHGPLYEYISLTLDKKLHTPFSFISRSILTPSQKNGDTIEIEIEIENTITCEKRFDIPIHLKKLDNDKIEITFQIENENENTSFEKKWNVCSLTFEDIKTEIDTNPKMIAVVSTLDLPDAPHRNAFLKEMVITGLREIQPDQEARKHSSDKKEIPSQKYTFLITKIAYILLYLQNRWWPYNTKHVFSYEKVAAGATPCTNPNPEPEPEPVKSSRSLINRFRNLIKKKPPKNHTSSEQLFSLENILVLGPVGPSITNYEQETDHRTPIQSPPAGPRTNTRTSPSTRTLYTEIFLSSTSTHDFEYTNKLEHLEHKLHFLKSQTPSYYLSEFEESVSENIITEHEKYTKIISIVDTIDFSSMLKSSPTSTSSTITDTIIDELFKNLITHLAYDIRVASFRRANDIISIYTAINNNIENQITTLQQNKIIDTPTDTPTDDSNILILKLINSTHGYTSFQNIITTLRYIIDYPPDNSNSDSGGSFYKKFVIKIKDWLQTSITQTIKRSVQHGLKIRKEYSQLCQHQNILLNGFMIFIKTIFILVGGILAGVGMGTKLGFSKMTGAGTKMKDSFRTLTNYIIRTQSIPILKKFICKKCGDTYTTNAACPCSERESDSDPLEKIIQTQLNESENIILKIIVDLVRPELLKHAGINLPFLSSLTFNDAEPMPAGPSTNTRMFTNYQESTLFYENIDFASRFFHIKNESLCDTKLNRRYNEGNCKGDDICYGNGGGNRSQKKRNRSIKHKIRRQTRRNKGFYHSRTLKKRSRYTSKNKKHAQ